MMFLIFKIFKYFFYIIMFFFIAQSSFHALFQLPKQRTQLSCLIPSPIHPLNSNRVIGLKGSLVTNFVNLTFFFFFLIC